jgi:hypothetical protein
VIFVDFRLTKNIFLMTESFVGRSTSNHGRQIFFTKSNCETMYHWFFLLEVTVVKKWKIWMFAPPTAIYTHGPGLRRLKKCLKSNAYQWSTIPLRTIKWTTMSQLKSWNIKKRSWHMPIEIKVQAWDKHKHVARLNPLIDPNVKVYHNPSVKIL